MTWSAFLGVFERHWPPAMPVAEWRAVLGEEWLGRLRRAGWFESRAINRGDSYPCPCPGGDGCPRRVVALRGRLVAVCGRDVEACDEVELGSDAEVLAVTAATLRQAMGAPLGLEGGSAATGGGRRVELGERRFGDGAAVMWFAAGLRGEAARLWAAGLRRRRAGHGVGVLVPRRAAVDGRVAELMEANGAVLLPLDEVAGFDDDEVTVDLADLVLANEFPGVELGRELWPGYELVLDPEAGRYWFRGQRLVTLERRHLAAKLLTALARRPGRLVTRDELAAAMWPDDYGARGSHEMDWDRRVRQQKRLLMKALAADLGEEVPAIESVASGSDVDGGYVLRELPSRVLLRSMCG